MRRTLILLVALAALGGAERAAAGERRDEAAVRAVENRWSEAFISGDAATLEALLDPTYISVNPAGRSRPKAEIIEIARSYAAKHPGEHAQPLPATSIVQIIGSTALVQHHGPSDVSIDLFEYRDGRWRARYSQHTAVAAPAA